MYTCMVATKTISIDIEAYERLSAARTTPNESFSKVIKRARWTDERHSAGALLAAIDDATPLGQEEIERLDAAQKNDQPPEDPWLSG